MTNCSRWMWSTALVFGSFVAGAGCQSQPAASTDAVFKVTVTLAGEPVQDVRVALLPQTRPEAGIVLEGITDATGVAGMMLTGRAELPVEPTAYAVVCESLGDWQIAPPWSDAERTPLVLTWPVESAGLEVALPKRAARSL